MITMLVLVKRKAGLTHEEFSQYWRVEHAKLTKTVPDFWRHVRRYVQYHPIKADARLSAFQGESFGYDGIGQMWFDSVEDMTRTFTHSGYVDIIRPHEVHFVEQAAFQALIAEEVVQYEGP